MEDWHSFVNVMQYSRQSIRPSRHVALRHHSALRDGCGQSIKSRNNFAEGLFDLTRPLTAEREPILARSEAPHMLLQLANFMFERSAAELAE
jgi:hypothetical protein